MTTNEKIAALRAAAQAAGAHGVLLMTSDSHSSEYLPAYYISLPFFSSGGTSLILLLAAMGIEYFFTKIFLAWTNP